MKTLTYQNYDNNMNQQYPENTNNMNENDNESIYDEFAEIKFNIDWI